MSDLVGNPEDRFYRVAARKLKLKRNDQELVESEPKSNIVECELGVHFIILYCMHAINIVKCRVWSKAVCLTQSDAQLRKAKTTEQNWEEQMNFMITLKQ